MKKRILIVLGLFIFNLSLFGQTAPFDVMIEPINIPNLGGIQSFAFGQDNGKWLIVGGRLDGLHRRQPWAAFDLAGHNNSFIVVDPITQQKWSAPLSSLPLSIQEQLSSTNMEFYQEGEYLYCLGGYGYSATIGDHTTFNNLTAIKVPDVINAIIANASFSSYIRQINDAQFQVTGGRLKKIKNNFYLIGGHKFIGRYNPMGPNHGPGFVQEYTNAIRVFSLNDDGTTITINHLSSYIDSLNLHRRDYNAEAQIMPNGEEGITAFSGVFQPTANLPFLNCVNIDTSGYFVNNTFQQYYNHYHCAVFPIYSAANNEMNTVFFGGIAQYYDNNGVLVQDNNVPFVNTIARVSRDANGTMVEYKLPIEMPNLMGAGAEFIPNKAIPHYNNEVFKFDDILTDTTLVGHIYGGISSSAANIFFTNTGVESSASSQIFKVYLIKSPSLSAHHLNKQSQGTLKMKVSPNPNDGNFIVNYFLEKRSDVKLTIFDASGKIIKRMLLTDQAIGEHLFSTEIIGLKGGGVYFLTLETSYEKANQKVIIAE